MSEKNCMKCHVFWFKQSLCKGGFCDEYWAEGKADDFINVIKPKWILCSERLPREDEEVLVYLYGDSPYLAWVDSNGQWMTNDFEIDKEDSPLAWMPLPQPYRGDDND